MSSSCASTASTINIAEWQGLAQRRRNNSKCNLNTENVKQIGQMATSQKHQHRLSFPGLPPLPQSLSGVEVTVLNSGYGQQNDRSENDGRIVDLDNHLAILKREMFGLRQLDLSLLSQLWALNEAIQEYRMMSQEQENFTIQSSSPSPSETISLSSTEDSNTSPPVENLYNGRKKMVQPRMQTAPPPPPTTTTSSSRDQQYRPNV